MIYLDNAASTPVHPDVLDVMIPYMREMYGNPSSIHRHGRTAERAVERAREQVARLVNCAPGGIIFTSGGTESNNTALAGMARGGGRIVTTEIEHEAVLEPCRMLEARGIDVCYLPADHTGMISLDELRGALTDDTRLVSIMLANNEVGTIQPMREAAAICHERNVPIHTDAVQAAGKIPVDVLELGVDMMSISSHKMNGPKGVGVLYVREGIRAGPLVLGGGQEGGMRSGTENVAGIAGFGKACEIASRSLGRNQSLLCSLRDRLVTRVMDSIPHESYNGRHDSFLTNNSHFTFL